MSTTTTPGKAIVAGYEWRIRVRSTAVVFPDGATYTSHVRPVGDPGTLLATLTSAGASITRIDGRTLELVIAGASSALWRTPVTLDVVRTDTSPDLHMGFFLTVPVVQPVTVL